MEPNVAIIILNWNGWEDTIECLESLYQINYHNYQIIVVDNGSENISIKKIKDYCLGKSKIKSLLNTIQKISQLKFLNFQEKISNETKKI